MRKASYIFMICFLQMTGAVPLRAQESRKLLEVGAEDCEFEMAVLDALANHLYSDANMSGYILIYGGRRHTKRDEVQIRGARMRRYMVENRGIEPKRISVVDGGYREKFSVELWLNRQSPSCRFSDGES